MNGESGSREAPALFLCLYLSFNPPSRDALRIPKLGSMLLKSVRLWIKILTALSKHCQNILLKNALKVQKSVLLNNSSSTISYNKNR